MIIFQGISVYELKNTIEGYYFYDRVLDKHYILNDNLIRFEVSEKSVRQLINGKWIKIKELKNDY